MLRSLYLQWWVAPIRFCCQTFFFFFSIFVHFTQTGIHVDTTMGCVVSVKSVHVDPAETDLATICTYWDKWALWRPGIWLKTTHRPAIIRRCCSSFQSAAKITSLRWLYWWCNRRDSSSSNMRRQDFVNYTCVLTPLLVFKPQAIKIVVLNQ